MALDQSGPLELVDGLKAADAEDVVRWSLARRPDRAQLADSFGRYDGTDGYDLAALRADLAASRSCSAATTANNSSATAKKSRYPAPTRRECPREP